MTIEVELPDGTIAEFPDGTAPDVIKGALSKRFNAAPQYASNGVPMNAAAKAEIASRAKAGTLTTPPRPQQAGIDEATEKGIVDRGALHAIVQGGTQGLTFGFGDEIVATGLSMLPGMPYEKALEATRGELDAARFTRPGTTMAAEVGGGIAGALGGVGIAARGATTLAGKAAAGAAAGAAEGSLYGFGSGEGGFQNRALEAGKTAAIGGIAGAAAPAVIAGAKAGASAIANPVASMLNIPSNVRASAAIEKMMGRAGMTTDDANRAISQATAEGQPDFLLADALGNSGQRGLSGIARQPGDARAMIAEALTRRQDGQGNRISAMLADALDAPDTAAARKTTMTAARKSAADSAYDAARTGAAPVDVTQTMDEINGLLRSNISIDGGKTGLADTAIGKRLAAFGKQLSTGDYQAIDFDDVLTTKKEMGRAIEVMKRNGGVPPEFASVYGKIDAALEASSDGYRAANDGFAKASREIDMIDEGAAATSGRVRAADTTARIGNMTPEQKSAFAAGYSDPLIARVESAAPGVNKARPLRNDKTTAELSLMARDPELLRRQIDRENTMFETANAALGGSKTADNLADAADVGAMSSSAIGNLLTGNWGAAGRQVLDKVMAGATGSNPATRELIAKALMSKNPAAALAPLAKRRGMTEPVEKVIEALIRSGAIRQ